jgi:hypothetical protein
VFGSWSPSAAESEAALLGAPLPGGGGGRATPGKLLDVRMRADGAGAAVVDDVFTRAALASLRRLCHESTTFFDLKVLVSPAALQKTASKFHALVVMAHACASYFRVLFSLESFSTLLSC